MADTTTSTLDAAVTLAYQQSSYFALRPQLQHDQLATVKATKQSHRGSSVNFTFYVDPSDATTPLTEGTEATPVALTDSTVNVDIDEYGLVINRTLKLTALGFLQYDADIANIVGYSGGSSLDQLAANELYAGDNVLYAGAATSRATVAATHYLDAHDVREAVANLNAASVMPFHGPPRAEGSMTPEQSGDSSFCGIIHPDIALDLREETGSAAWSDPVAYSAADRRWNNELGKFEGVRWITSPRAEMWADGGVTTTDVYGTIICGQQALAKLYSTVTGPTAQVRFGAITDNLMRERPAGWLWIGGYGRFREASLRRIEAASSIGANT